MGDQVTLVNPAYETARELKELLQHYDILNEEEPHLGENKYQFYVSDGAEKFKRFALSILTISLSKYLSAAFVAASPGRRGRINDISCLPDGSWRASARLRDLITQNKKCGGVYAAAPQ